jgi:hypothetical protein
VSINDCERAITAFTSEAHNYAIAQVFRAQIARQMKQWQDAFDHFNQALRRLDEMITDRSGSDDVTQINFYQELWDVVNAAAKAASEQSRQATDIPVSQRPESPAVEPLTPLSTESILPTHSVIPPIDLPIPTQLVWPMPDTVGLGLVLVSGGFADDQNHIGFESGKDALDYVEVSQISINGKPYTVHPIISPSSSSNALRLHQGQQYIVMQVNGNGEKTKHSNQYVLVRRQNWPDRAGQKVVVADSPHKRVWVWMTEKNQELAPPNIIGGAYDTRDEDQGERKWKINDGSETLYYSSDEIRIIGIVEAVLTPTIPTEPLPPSAPTIPPQADINDGQRGKELVSPQE